MYFFVRFTGIVTIVFGAMLMLLGVGGAIYGFVQNAALVDLVNNYWMAGGNTRLVDARFYAAVFGLALFISGMITAALGQLMLIFVNIANNSQQTNSILRGIRRVE